MASLEPFEDNGDDANAVLMYEYVSGEPSVKKRSVDSRPPLRVNPAELPWAKSDDRDTLPTKSHVNRRFDELQRTVCGAVGVLHGEVAALKSAIALSESTEEEVNLLNPAERVETLSSSIDNINHAQLRELFDLISEYELVPTVDVSEFAFKSLGNVDGPLRAAAASALGVIRPLGAMSALATAYESETNRHIKRIIGSSLKAVIQ